MKDGRCTCEAFQRAMQPWTDDRGCGALFMAYAGTWYIGDLLPAPKFCPWCGCELPAVPGDSPDEQPGCGS